MSYKRIQKRLSVNLWQIRTERGLTQEQMAARCGMATQQYSKIESGQANLTLATIAHLVDRLDVDVADLFAPLPRKNARG